MAEKRTLREAPLLNQIPALYLGMKELKIVHQNSLILHIIAALKTCVQGTGIRETYSIRIKRGSYHSQITFSKKDGTPIEPIDFFMLGYFVGRDYEK